uniref:Transmembrane protein n=1 Tax=Attheya septentrionalis TaxID=420275 RepID=A0A7S2XPH2_9STRA|mmetsp:Transcript_26874/g.48859  ORF Transcript_26874/g.48859 Transcript_26874/m.48859 type:complete len:523 (+) Transcript_26874:74-1642(+)
MAKLRFHALQVLAVGLISLTSLVLAEQQQGQQHLNEIDRDFANENQHRDYSVSMDVFDPPDEFERYLQTSETTTCNFWCQLKNSLGMTIVGLLLICISPCFMWKNEGRHVRELRRIDFCKNKAVIVSESPSDENNGNLVHFVGEVSVGEANLELAPNGLNVTQPVPKALIIKRTCCIYQKFEDANSQTEHARVGGGTTTTTTFTCREDWTPMGPQPAQLEHLPEEKNTRGIWDSLVTVSGGEVGGESTSTPPNMPPNLPPQMAAMLQKVDAWKAPNGIAVSPAAHVGGFSLSEEIITEQPAVFSPEWSSLPADLVPDAVEGCEGLLKHSDGILRTNAEGETPANGDVMVKYEYCTDGFEASFVVEQIVAAESDPEVGAKYGVQKAHIIDDKCCGKIHDDLGVIWMVRRGRHDLHDMISMAAEDEKSLTKILRIISYVVLIIGWVLLFSIFQTFLNTLPILGKLGAFAIFLIAFIVGTVCCCGVTALAYFRYRPLISFVIIAVGLGIWGLVVGMLGREDTSIE